MLPKFVSPETSGETKYSTNVEDQNDNLLYVLLTVHHSIDFFKLPT